MFRSPFRDDVARTGGGQSERHLYWLLTVRPLAFVDQAGLRNARCLGNAGDAAIPARLGAKAVVDLDPALLCRAYRSPVALGIIGAQA
jgi:hypothetical protein